MKGDIAQKKMLFWNKEIRNTAVKGKTSWKRGEISSFRGKERTGFKTTLSPPSGQKMMLNHPGALDAHLFRDLVPFWHDVCWCKLFCTT